MSSHALESAPRDESWSPRDESWSPRGIARAIGPYLCAALLGWIVVVVGNSVGWVDYGVASVLLALACSMPFIGPHKWHRGGMPAGLLFLAAVAMLRSAGGGRSTGVAGLAILPVFFTALNGTRRELAGIVTAVACFFIAPILVIGGQEFPHSQYRSAIITVAVSSILGVVTHGLVAKVRREARESRRRGRLLEEVNETLRSLFDSEHARQDVCAAARRLGGASVAILFEPIGAGGALRATAIDGAQLDLPDIAGDEHTMLGRALTTGEASLVTGDMQSSVASVEQWLAAGSPCALLFEPLLHAGETIGVLVVGWPQPRDASSSRVTVVKLLAHETAALLDRADRMSELADRAETDALTGLPNRRAWDTCCEQAIGEGREIAVAMFDLDHFKQFNDTFGHPAGDRLLKETAAVWRDGLRAGDLLARLGGEEFGLLLLDCDESQATEVTERLRRGMPQRRTCSAGLAIRAPGESVERTMSRADAALYEAKSAGRDRTCLAAVTTVRRPGEVESADQACA